MTCGALAATMTGCLGTVPRDPDGTLDTVTDGTIRIGVSLEPEVAEAGEAPDDAPRGPLADLARDYADSIDARISWTPAGEETLVGMLEDGDIDLAIGTVQLFGQTIWLGWLMVGVMSVIVIGPVFFYGPAKARLAPLLHNKLLHADADMAKADWQTNAASILGVMGIGLGVWWLDGVAALFISIGIVRDGVRNTRSAVRDLMDQRARTYDDKAPHPLAAEVAQYLRHLPWVGDAAVRMRDEGQVFHIEAFVRPYRSRVSLAKLRHASEGIAALDWKVQDVVVIPVEQLPDEADRGTDASASSAG